jgi:hypothetical protein
MAGPGAPIPVQIQTKGGIVKLSLDPFRISKSQHQQILWTIDDEKLHFNIEFTDGSPFEYTQFSDLEPYSGLVRRDVLGSPRYYKYTVTVTAGSTAAGYKPVGKPLDPGGVVDA